ncbi:hypothetical protein D3C73_730610 [compost metagenome]
MYRLYCVSVPSLSDNVTRLILDTLEASMVSAAAVLVRPVISRAADKGIMNVRVNNMPFLKR